MSLSKESSPTQPQPRVSIDTLTSHVPRNPNFLSDRAIHLVSLALAASILFPVSSTEADTIQSSELHAETGFEVNTADSV